MEKIKCLKLSRLAGNLIKIPKMNRIFKKNWNWKVKKNNKEWYPVRIRNQINSKKMNKISKEFFWSWKGVKAIKNTSVNKQNHRWNRNQQFSSCNLVFNCNEIQSS